jgi:hypothetical protein
MISSLSWSTAGLFVPLLAEVSLLVGKREPCPVIFGLYTDVEVVGLRVAAVLVAIPAVRLRVAVDVAGRGGMAETDGLGRTTALVVLVIGFLLSGTGFRPATRAFTFDTGFAVVAGPFCGAAVFSDAVRDVGTVDEVAVPGRETRLAVALAVFVVDATDGARVTAVDLDVGIGFGATAGVLLFFASVLIRPGTLEPVLVDNVVGWKGSSSSKNVVRKRLRIY